MKDRAQPPLKLEIEQLSRQPIPLSDNALEELQNALTVVISEFYTFYITDTGYVGRSHHPDAGGFATGDILVTLFDKEIFLLLRHLADGRYRMINIALVTGFDWTAISEVRDHAPYKDWLNFSNVGLQIFEVVWCQQKLPKYQNQDSLGLPATPPSLSLKIHPSLITKSPMTP